MRLRKKVNKPRKSQIWHPTKNCATLPDAHAFHQILNETIKGIPLASYPPGDFSFTQGGPLSMEFLTTFLLFMVADGNQRGIQHLVLDFWDQVGDRGLPLPTEEPVSASAIGQARQRLPDDLFRLLLHGLNDEADKGTLVKRWRGRRVYGVDGQKLNVGTWPDLKDEFGVAEGSYCPQVLMSTMVDVFTRVPIDYEVDSRLHVDERAHLLRMLPSVDAGDLVILDRGYPSHETLQELTSAGIPFLVRLPRAGTFKLVEAFVRSGAADKIVTIDPPQGADPNWQPLKVRLLRIGGPDGPAYYATSLTSSSVSIEDIAYLYHLRWECEECFKLFTSNYVGQEQFRSRRGCQKNGVSGVAGGDALHPQQ